MDHMTTNINFRHMTGDIQKHVQGNPDVPEFPLNPLSSTTTMASLLRSSVRIASKPRMVGDVRLVLVQCMSNRLN